MDRFELGRSYIGSARTEIRRSRARGYRWMGCIGRKADSLAGLWPTGNPAKISTCLVVSISLNSKERGLVWVEPADVSRRFQCDVPYVRPRDFLGLFHEVGEAFGGSNVGKMNVKFFGSNSSQCDLHASYLTKEHPFWVFHP